MILVPPDSSRLPGSRPWLSRAATLRPRSPFLRTTQTPGVPELRRAKTPGSTACINSECWESQLPTGKEPTAPSSWPWTGRDLPSPKGWFLEVWGPEACLCQGSRTDPRSTETMFGLGLLQEQKCCWSRSQVTGGIPPLKCWEELRDGF